MIHTLKEPFDFGGQRITEIRLSDYVKAKHNLAYARVTKLSREMGLSGISSEQDLGSLSEVDMIKYLAFEVESQQILLESFAEGFPKDALPELSMADCNLISEEINRVMREHSKKYGTSESRNQPGKKKIQPVRSGR